nr:hypothetical protein BaRGS_008166 [Batillaria attramentaria]
MTAFPPRSIPQGEENNHNGGSECGMDEGDVPLDMHVSIISCKMCPETFPTSADLRDHVDIVHGSLPKKPRVSESDFLTPYHRLGSELFQESALMPNGHSDSQSEALSLTKPKQTPEQKDYEMSRDQNGEMSTKVDGGKIFHQDAYCELCDREFCNKYFLKTHKANKHGIFESSPPSSVSGGPPDSLPPFEVNLPAPPPQKVELSPSPWQQQQRPKSNESSSKPDRPPPLPPPPKKSEAEMATEKKVSSLISAVMNSVPSSQASEGKSSSGSGSNSSSSTTKDPSMEDYCEICQKHFCNKYYLKKHKQDVHGIIPETGPTTSKRSRASSSLLDLPTVSSVGMAPMLLPQPMASMGAMPALPPGVMVLNPFLQQMTIIPTGNIPQPLLHGHQLHPPPQSPVISQPLPMPGTLPGPSPTPPTSSSSQGRQSQASPIGVMNPDAYCSMCRKEFCNKYFLKIHNANKHGIACDEIPPEAKLLGDMVESNGVVLPPPHSSKDHKQDSHSHSDSRRSSPPPLTSINQMVTCRQCDKDFPNAQAYKVHQINEHGKGLEGALPDSLEGSLPRSSPSMGASSSESLLRMAADASAAAHAAAAAAAMGSGPSGPGSNGSGGTTMFGNMVAAKLADRVTCDICNKELCNKYFLKSHKLKMHGVDVEKDEGAGKSSQSSGAERSPQQPSPASKHQPVNMSMGGKPPMGMMPKLELRDYPDYGKDLRDYRMMEKFAPFKNFSDVPNFLAETINNEFFRRAQPPFKGLDFGHPGLAPTSAECPPAEELVKMGIDPEAYCEICKKEFCSKYFLRTHKQNIHGIKPEIPDTDRSRARPGPKSSPLSKASSNNNNGSFLAGVPMPPGLGFGPGGLSSLGGGSSRDGGGGAGGGSRGKDGYEKHTWRWKDPVNSARVTCDICNKEVCNKYFLRTHKQNKHGIAPSDKSLSPSMSGSPVPSDVDASSNTSSQPDNFLVDKATGMMHRPDGMSVPQSIPLPPSDKNVKPTDYSRSRGEEEKGYGSTPIKPVSSSGNNNNNNNNNNNSGNFATCHLCDRQFKNTQWLTAHLMKDHAELSDPEAMDMRMLPPIGRGVQSGEAKMCQVCRVVLPNELNLQLHLIQEHNAQVRLQMDDDRQKEHHAQIKSPIREAKLPLASARPAKSWRVRKQSPFAARKLKMYVCSACDYQTYWHSKLLFHEEQVHSIVPGTAKVFACQSCPKSFPSQGALTRHVESQHGKTMEEYLDGGESPASVKMFRCGLCTSRFTTHGFCQVHLKDVHIHMLKDFASRKRAQGSSKLTCAACSFKTLFPSRLRSHVTRYHCRLPLTNGQAGNGEHVSSSERKIEADPESKEDSTLAKVEASARDESSAEDLLKQTFQLDVRSGSEATTLTSSSNFVSAVAAMPVRQRVEEPVSVSFLLTPVTP